MDIDQIIYSNQINLIKKIYHSIIINIPDLQFNGKFNVYGFDKLSKNIGDVLGLYSENGNIITIHKCCFDEYSKGNKETMIKTIMHELIHASGEHDEKITEDKTIALFKKHRKEILNLL